MLAQPALLILLGDALCLSLFIMAGLTTHDSASPLTRFALNAGPLIVAWAIVAGWQGALRVETFQSGRGLLNKTLTAWLIAAPLALIARAFLLRAATLILIFVLITLGLGGACLLLWRGGLFWWLRRRHAKLA